MQCPKVINNILDLLNKLHNILNLFKHSDLQVILAELEELFKFG